MASIEQEIVETRESQSQSQTVRPSRKNTNPVQVIDLSTSDGSDSEENHSHNEDNDNNNDDNKRRKKMKKSKEKVLKKKKKKKQKKKEKKKKRLRNEEGPSSSAKKSRATVDESILPLGFLDPLPPDDPLSPENPSPPPQPLRRLGQTCRQFWKAGNYEGDPTGDSISFGMDHVRVHPKFLHSNATSHKWALGAFAELLDNSLDEVCHGATFVNIDMLENKKDKSKMLLIEDNGGGMDPDKLRQCMSLGYSMKSKQANTIGQYGNGFKTSTMRLGADVIVFTCSCPRDGKSSTRSIGMLSYTFLRSTRKEDIVVPMLDYERDGKSWKKLYRSSEVDWSRNVETVVKWSPYSSEAELLLQFNSMKDQGTRVIIYNLWEDDQGKLELDFSADRHDIQIRGVNRDENKIQMAKQYPNSRHFLTYQHSLRNYSSILYLRLPVGFRIILRGKDVQQHNIVNDMMLIQEVTYRPQPSADGVPKDSNIIAVVTMGFVKDAKYHIDVQGFNVYHKNRLIKPFWRVWNSSGSDGRGVVGVLEADFIEPAHDKQGFERTTVLARLEAKLIQMQKTYWYSNCHKIGYAPRVNKKNIIASSTREVSPDDFPHSSSRHSSQNKRTEPSKTGNRKHPNGKLPAAGENRKAVSKSGKKASSPPMRLHNRSPTSGDESDHEVQGVHERIGSEYFSDKASSSRNCSEKNVSATHQPSFADAIVHHASKSKTNQVTSTAHAANGISNDDEPEQAYLMKLKEENHELTDRLQKLGEKWSIELQFERDKVKSLEAKACEAENMLEQANKEHDALIEIFSEERIRRDKEEEILRKKLKDASMSIQELLEKVSSSDCNKRSPNH